MDSKRPTHIGLIGFGSIGREVHKRLSRDPAISMSALTRSPLENCPSDLVEVRDFDGFMTAAPDLVVECAGHDAVRSYGPAVLETGTPLLIASVGALADARLATDIETAAQTGGARVIYPSGAIGGLDVLRAVAAEGAVEVVYRGTKPPHAWKGSATEQMIDLSDMASPEVFFRGSAREAALLWPKNANVVAALALSGVGFDALQVDLVADPSVSVNTHRYTVSAPACRYDFSIENRPSADNPRTSLTTVLSIVEDIRAFVVLNG